MADCIPSEEVAKRWTPQDIAIGVVKKEQTVARDSKWIRLEDHLSELERERERRKGELRTATSATAVISAAVGRARLMVENPDLDGFTVDEELDEIAAQVKVLRNALAVEGEH